MRAGHFRLVPALVVVALAGAVAPLTTAHAQAQGVSPASTTSDAGFVFGWGRNGETQLGPDNPVVCPLFVGECPHPFRGTGSFGVVSVSGGIYHTVFLLADGTVWALGLNSFGQLGDGTTTKRSQPVRVDFGNAAPTIVAVAAGAYQSLALDSDGHVWAWGKDNGGTVPTQIPALSDVKAIAAGGDLCLQDHQMHSLALLNDGSVVAWGSNAYGQLGNGTTSSSTVPVAVSGIGTATAISAGGLHSLALLEDGTVVAWGHNNAGQLGDGTTDDASEPVPVNGLSGITAIHAGWVDSWTSNCTTTASHSVALKSDGTVWTWGANVSGQLGNSTTSTGATSAPVQASGITNAVSVAAGAAHTLALLTDHTVRSWGSNGFGALGDGTTTPRSTPGPTDPLNPIGAIDAGAYHNLAIVPLGSLGEYTSMTPARFLDTRADGVTADGKYRATGMINPGGSQDVQITGRNGVPATGVSAVVLNATVTEPTQPSFLTVWPTGFTRPTVSNLNYEPGETVPNLVTAALGVGGKVSVYNHNGSTHVVFDVVGYYSSIPGPDGTRVHMITPARIMDTRGFPTIDGQSQGGGAVGQNQTRDLDVTGRGGVPASNVTAVVVNVTVVQPTVFGYVTAYPGDVAKPNASTLNFVAGETVPNLAIVRVPDSGILKFYNLFGNTHLVVDVVGYFDDDESTDAGRVIPLFPGRLFDTRLTGFGPLPANQTLSLNMSTFNAGITNSQASGYVLNTTVTQPSAEGYLTVYPGDVVKPLASNLNFVGGQTVPNLVMTKVGCPTFPRINFYNSPFGSTHLLADAFGVITNSLKFDPTVSAPPAVPAELGAADVRDLEAPSDFVTPELG